MGVFESQFSQELESHICVWSGNQLSDAVVQLLVLVMSTEYYFSVLPTPDVQAAQLSNYTKRPYDQATTASGVFQNLGLWKVSIKFQEDGGKTSWGESQ